MPLSQFRPAQGDADGLDAVAKATAAGCPPNSVVYFDWEVGSMTAPQIQHCRRWCAAVAASGFRPGFLCAAGRAPRDAKCVAEPIHMGRPTRALAREHRVRERGGQSSSGLLASVPNTICFS